MRGALIVVLALSAGCRRDEAPVTPEAAAPATPPVAERRAAEPEAAPATSPPPASNDRQDALAATYQAVYCATKRADRTGLQAIFDRHGFVDAAAFSAAFSTQREVNAAWAERVMAKAASADCP